MMIKDLIANLDVDSSRDVTADYTISVGRAFLLDEGYPALNLRDGA
jgi:hypothetical protein